MSAVRRMMLFVFATTMAWAAHGQTEKPQTAEELAAATALLKAQQAYYDQLLLTAKSQQAATDANLVNATASISALTALQNAQMTNDLALATALKSSGLSAATGREGSVTIASAEKTLLALQRGSLVGSDKLAAQICEDLKVRDFKDVFFAPANFESLVEKSVPDVVQLASLNSAAVAGKAEYASAQMQVAVTAIAGALVSAQYIAGGIQALTKLFRNDYAVTITPNTRAGLIEQRIAATCEPGRVIYGVEGRLRLNAGKILVSAVTNIAAFVQLHEEWNDQVTAKVVSLTARRTAIAADTKVADDKKAQAFKLIDDALAAESERQLTLAKYKTVAATMKTFLTGLTAQSSVFDSVVWGQELLLSQGGWPNEIVNLSLTTKPRLLLTTNVQDAAVTKSSVFFANTITGISTVEAYYAVVKADGTLGLSGIYSGSSQTEPMDFSNPTLHGYVSTLPPKPEAAEASGARNNRSAGNAGGPSN